ncbi:PolC-type DNA polymerase III [Shivajiella indica]|uniref:PolC-type DNA polymerase III n=1 Tax=Shivajiella indica TaxID=872115 RepID=A0ABW5B5D7_9BACT
MGIFDFLGKKKAPKSTFVQQYEELFERKIPSVRPIKQLNFVVIDTETTGLDPQKDYIISFGGIKVSNYSINLHTAKELYLDFKIQNRESIKVHEIIQPLGSIPLKDFGNEVLDYISSDIVVGHHIGFDLAMLEKALRPFGLKKILNPVLDTHYLAIRLEKGPHFDYSMARPGEYALDNLCERFGITLDDRHTAAGDAFLTAQLLMKLLKAAENKGIKDFGDLFRKI